MNLLLSLWTLAGAAILKLSPLESAALIMLAASLVVFRTFRERYLLVWILGWMVYLVSRMPLASSDPQYGRAIAEGTFVLAVCLFAAAVFSYTRAKNLFLPLLFISLGLVGYAVARPLLWPDSVPLRMALEVAYRLVAVTAAIELIKVRWGRWEIGPWLMSLSLLALNLDWPALIHLPMAVSVISDLLLGLSMLLVVFDDSRARTRRLGVVNALTTSIARATQSGPMLLTALEELKKLMKARAAWFRLQQEDDRLVVVQQIGLSPDFMMARGSIATDDRLRAIIQDGKAAVIKTKSADPDLQASLQNEKFHHVVMLPVRGKKSVIGVLSMRSRHCRSYTPEARAFL